VASLLIGAGIGWLIFSEVRGPLSKAFGTPRKAKRGKRRVTRKAKAVAATRSK